MVILSVIIPGRHEPFMQKTIDSLFAASELGSALDVIAVLDGPWMEEPVGDSRLKIIRIPPKGMRGAINAGLETATGHFIMKVDAHCAFAQGFDRIMVNKGEEQKLLIPRRWAIDELAWDKSEDRGPADYHYLRFPLPDPPMSPHRFKHSGPELDDTMSFQGSCWMADRRFFLERIGLLDDSKETYGSFAAEQLEIGLKYWLGGYEVKVYKGTWYAHMFKMPRHYGVGFHKKGNFRHGWNWATWHWLNDREPGMVRPFSWLVEKFWPVPSWPDDWREQWKAQAG